MISQESLHFLLVMLAAGLGGALAELLRQYLRFVRSQAHAARQQVLVIEFWVYSRNPQRPTQEDLTRVLIGDGPPRIGTAEALVFTDVRFHMGTVKREAPASSTSSTKAIPRPSPSASSRRKPSTRCASSPSLAR